MNSILFVLISIHIIFIQCNMLSFQENIFNNILKKKKGQNILISPFSIYQILSLTSNGAIDETQKEKSNDDELSNNYIYSSEEELAAADEEDNDKYDESDESIENNGKYVEELDVSMDSFADYNK